MNGKAWNSTLPQRTRRLTARAGLSRTGGKTLANDPVPPRRQRQAGFLPATKKAIRRRAGHRCEACGCPVPPGFGNIQHRSARKMGGSRLAWVNSVVNGVLLCGTPFTGDHGLCESRDTHMHAQGFWLEQHEHPAEVPIMLHGEFGGVLAWLTPAGGYSAEAPGGRSA